MKKNTEQERQEFLDQVGHLIMDGTIETRSAKRAGISFACGNLHAAFLVWKAARRAPVVPQGWKLAPDVPTHEMQDACLAIVDLEESCPDDHRYSDGRNTVDAIFAAMLAAAPQPPDDLKRGNPATKADDGPSSCARCGNPWGEAAPVKLPEYGIDTANHAGIRVRGYTEQQVRQLLAAQGQRK